MAKAVTLKNSNGDELYPTTIAELVNGQIQTPQIADDGVTTDKIDWSTTGTTDSGWYRHDFGTLHILYKPQGFNNLSKSWQTIGTVPSDLASGQLVFFRWTGVFGNSGNCLSYSAQMNSSGVIQAQIDSPSGNNGGWSFAVIRK